MTTITRRKAIAPAQIKAEGQEEETGSFKALVATYDVDSVGDKIMPGAFAKSLARWEESGTLIPVIWSHDSGGSFFPYRSGHRSQGDRRRSAHRRCA